MPSSLDDHLVRRWLKGFTVVLWGWSTAENPGFMLTKTKHLEVWWR